MVKSIEKCRGGLVSERVTVGQDAFAMPQYSGVLLVNFS
jgi:hypothetical protein